MFKVGDLEIERTAELRLSTMLDIEQKTLINLPICLMIVVKRLC